MAVKTGFSMFSFSEDACLKEIFPVIRAAGYDGVEPVLGEGGYLRPQKSYNQYSKPLVS